jgi:hypothetical protein
MSYNELGGMDALLVDRIYTAYIIRRELERCDLDERAERAAIMANGMMEDTGKALRGVQSEFANRRQQILELADTDPFEQAAEDEFSDGLWWERDAG